MMVVMNERKYVEICCASVVFVKKLHVACSVQYDTNIFTVIILSTACSIRFVFMSEISGQYYRE